MRTNLSCTQDCVEKWNGPNSTKDDPRKGKLPGVQINLVTGLRLEVRHNYRQLQNSAQASWLHEKELPDADMPHAPHPRKAQNWSKASHRSSAQTHHAKADEVPR